MANLRQVSTEDQVDREAESIKRFLASEKEPVIIAWGTAEGMASYTQEAQQSRAEEIASKRWSEVEPLVAHAYIHAFVHGHDQGEQDASKEIIAWIESKGFQVSGQEVAAYLQGRLIGGV